MLVHKYRTQYSGASYCNDSTKVAQVNYSSAKNFSRGGIQFCVSANGEVVYYPNGNNIHPYRIHTGDMLPILQGHYEK